MNEPLLNVDQAGQSGGELLSLLSFFITYVAASAHIKPKTILDSVS